MHSFVMQFPIIFLSFWPQLHYGKCCCNVYKTGQMRCFGPLSSDRFFCTAPYSYRVRTHAGACMLLPLMLTLLDNFDNPP